MIGTEILDCTAHVSRGGHQKALADILTGHLISGAVGRWPGADGALVEDILQEYSAMASARLVPGELALCDLHPDLIPQVISTNITSFELNSFDDPYLQINTRAGYKIKLDSSSDFNKTLGRLSLLISQILPGDLKNLSYIDLRFTDKAYTCSKISPCINNTNLPPATTTPTSLHN